MSVFKHRMARLAGRARTSLGRAVSSTRPRTVQRTSGDRDGGIRPENVVWIFGAGRTGSTWLSFMMDSLPDFVRWNEPLVGYLYGHTYYERAEQRKDEKHFVLGDAYKDIWLGSARNLVLDGIDARFPEVSEKSFAVIKEPHGAIGAPLLMEALPESRIIFLVRDPRDVAASALDASWITRRRETQREEKRRTRAQQNPDAFLKNRAQSYLQDIKYVNHAYEAHRGHKVLVRYEDLRADTLGTMRRICSTLELPAGEKELAAAVEEHAWENIPEKDKGSGKGRRKATAGGWREDLSPEQADMIARKTAWILDKFYAGV